MPESLSLHQRLHAVMKEIAHIPKETKQGMRYAIVSHDAVTEKVKPLLVKYGILCYPTELFISQEGNRTSVQLKMRFQNVDEPMESIDVPSAGYGIDDQDKGPGKAMSYAVKYALLKTFNLETGDDPDLEQEVVHKPARAAATHPVEKELIDGTYEVIILDERHGISDKGPWQRVKTGDGSAWNSTTHEFKIGDQEEVTVQGGRISRIHPKNSVS